MLDESPSFPYADRPLPMAGTGDIDGTWRLALGTGSTRKTDPGANPWDELFVVRGSVP